MPESAVIALIVCSEVGRSGLAQQLRQAGYQVIEGVSGQEAMSLANQKPALMIIDAGIPDVPFLTVCQTLKRHPATSSILLLPVAAIWPKNEQEISRLEAETDGVLTPLDDRQELIVQVKLLLRLRQKPGCWAAVAKTAASDQGESGALPWTEIERVLEEAEEGKNTLAALMEHIPMGITIADAPDVRIRMVSQHGQKIMERAESEIAHISASDQVSVWGIYRADGITPGTPEELPLTRATTKGEIVKNEEWIVTRKDGTLVPILCHAAPIRDKAGQVVGGVIGWQDITERRLAEQALRQSEERFRNLAESMPQLVWTANSDGTVEYYNSRVSLYQGFQQVSEDQWIWQPVVHPEDLPVTLALWQEALASGQTYQVEHRIRMADDSYRWHLSRAYPARRSDGALQWFGTATDIHEIKQAQEAAHAANQAKSQFLANMSHELRTPMNAILGMTDLALSQPIPQATRDFLITTKDSADQLLELLNEILDFSRIEAGHFEMENAPFDLPELVEKTIKTLGVRACEKGLELVYELAEDLPPCLRGDAMRLRQVLTNLVGNAIKFTHQGEIVVRVAVEDNQSNQVRLRCAVSDTGIGIAQEHLVKIFDPFTQADASTTRHYGGSGLGLAISQRLVTLMGGRIGVESVLGQGSTFYFTVVLSKGPGGMEESWRGPAVGLLRDRPVLVVASNAAQRRVLTQMLRQWQMQPQEAADVPSALAKIHQQAASGRKFELILTDAVMPTVNGFTLAEWLRQDSHLSGPVLLMLSVADRQHYPEQCGEPGRIFLDKPITHTSLLSAMVRALGLELEWNHTGSPNSAATRPSRLAHSLNILLAEDTPANQKLVQHVLGGRGHTVQMAQNGVQALALLEQQDFDLILMDVQMPEMDGLEATCQIRSMADPLKARVPIIALTAHALKGDQEKCLAAGMNAYLSKPIKAQQMIELVESLSSPSPEEQPDMAKFSAKPSSPGAAILEPGTPLFNLERALQACYGSYEIFKEMVGCFYVEAEPLTQQMQAALSREDASGILQLAHRLLNTVAYLGTEPLNRALRVLEQAGQSRDLVGITQGLAIVMIQVEATRQALASHIADVANCS